MAAYWEITAHSANDMFSKYMYLIVYLVLSRLGIVSGNFHLIAPFHDHCLPIPFFLICQHEFNKSVFCFSVLFWTTNGTFKFSSGKSVIKNLLVQLFAIFNSV